MLHRTRLFMSGAALVAVVVVAAVSDATAQSTIGGQVLHLRHSINNAPRQGLGGIAQRRWTIIPATPLPVGNQMRWEGGDRGAPAGQGFTWLMEADRPCAEGDLPPFLVFALKHTGNQQNVRIAKCGHDPANGPESFAGFRRFSGGDRSAPSGVGFVWYESLGPRPNWAWVDRMPSGAVIMLKHSMNQANRTFGWRPSTPCMIGGRPTACDPARSDVAPPPGFVRMGGGDLGAPSGQGYFWYQKR